MLKKARADLDEIRFSNLGDVQNWRIKVYCNASFARLNNVDTVTGDLVTVEGENGAMAILEWTSSKLKVPANSPLNGESEAAMAAQGKIVHYRHMLQQIFGANVPGEIVTDSKSLEDAVQSKQCRGFGPLGNTLITIIIIIMMMLDIVLGWGCSRTQLLPQLVSRNTVCIKCLVQV